MFSGDTIGKYRLINRLGKGGMGEVWLATASGHGGFTKTVVIKTLLPEYACDPLFIEMLANEARICAKLSHPNLIEVFDFTEHGGIYLLAMEHVMGRPLHQIMRAAAARKVPVPAWFALRIAWECCRGLEYAHNQGVIHCDLSPSNVMVTFTGITKILDFGVAHSMAHGAKADRLKGKFSYIAPERLKSLATDCRTDIYSLGVMLYLVFTGQLPFTANSDAELLRKIVKTRPRKPSELAPIDPRIERLIIRAMQPDPAKRYQTVTEVIAELTPCLEGQLGTYGQQDVASFVGQLFETPEPEPALPPIPPPLRPTAGDESDVSTRDPGAVIDLDFDDGSSVLAIPVEAPEPPRLARGSAWSAPIKKPVDGPSKLFEHVAHDIPDDPRTTVQSLFGDRPSSLAFGPSKIFERAPIETPPDEPAPAPAPVVVEPTEPAMPDSREAARRGGFGSYSSTRRQTTTVWPWTSSRTKSD
jgi:serine/threonine-protein kinase